MDNSHYDVQKFLAVVGCELSLASVRENLRMNSGERSEADSSQMLQTNVVNFQST